MNIDYTYCLNQDTCIHRRGCKRWIGNYTEEEVIEESNSNVNGYINDEKCMSSKPYPFAMLDRFRYSDGSEIK